MKEFLFDETVGFLFGLIVGGALTKLWDIIQTDRHAGWDVISKGAAVTDKITDLIQDILDTREAGK